MVKSYLVGIAGGSASGKTTFARKLKSLLGEENCSLLYQDRYYIDQSHKFDFDGGSVNFDHPDAIDFNLLGSHLQELKKGNTIQAPRYDFATHSREKEHDEFKPKPIILIDGILILSQKQVYPHFDRSFFVDTPENLRFERRLKRDTEERGRTAAGVKDQFYKQVKPMHDEFVDPSKVNADLIIGVDDFEQKLDFVYSELSREILL